MRPVKTVSTFRLRVAFALAPVLVSILSGANPGAARSTAVTPPEEIVSGPARVVDGDTIEIAGTRIRLEGIDAPEAGQTCQDAKGVTWACGRAATREMVEMTRDRSVDCHSRGLDKYGRTLAVCFVDGVDVNAEMVKRGLAWAFIKYSRHYVVQEAAAKQVGIGIWQGTAVPAWEYRAQRWVVVAEAAPEGCAIKGNVSAAGLIYHLPWSPWYDKVSMDAKSGKRWFCTEAEALASGWRPAYTR